jgi:hypothetical protein
MALTRVSPALFQVSNNITSVTVGGSANTISLTFDSNGVITGASNNAVSVANTAITGNIISSQITSVANTQITGTISVANTAITGNIISSQIAPSVTLTTPIISGNLNLDSAGTTGIRVPSANNISFHTAGTEDVRIDSSGNMGIGTSTPAKKLDISYSSTSTTAVTAACLQLVNRENSIGYYSGVINFCRIDSTSPMAYIGSIQESTSGNSNNNLVFGTRNGEATLGERMRITAAGDILFGTTGFPNVSGAGSGFINDGESRWQLRMNQSTTDARALITFNNPNGGVGSISTSGSSTAYNTSSDYRLKENIVPMTAALSKVAQLKPCTYKWKCDGTDGEGFIAHELAEVCPQAVAGTKDAVDADGNLVHQGVDTSFLVATLTAAIQELKAINDTQAATITALTARVVALES